MVVVVVVVFEAVVVAVYCSLSLWITPWNVRESAQIKRRWFKEKLSIVSKSRLCIIFEHINRACYHSTVLFAFCHLLSTMWMSVLFSPSHANHITHKPYEQTRFVLNVIAFGWVTHSMLFSFQMRSCLCTMYTFICSTWACVFVFCLSTISQSSELNDKKNVSK